MIAPRDAARDLQVNDPIADAIASHRLVNHDLK
jgi:hypothetical protein